MYKFKYISGLRPVPRIAIFESINIEIFNSIYLEMTEKFRITFNQQINSGNIHIWNSAAYLVYDVETLEIINVAFNDFANIVFLFRYINKELWCDLNEGFFKLFKDESKQFLNEFLLDI